MSKACDVAIIGAGPYGLSLAAHLRARGIDFRVFGRPLSTWRAHMPKNMMLKSDGFASNLSTPAADSTLKEYCAENDLPYADEALPISLDTFLAYSDAFQQRFVPELEDTEIVSLQRDTRGFTLSLEHGERVTARNVVLAVGITWFAHMPKMLSALPSDLASHSFHHREGEQFRGREVAVIGSGSSAIDTAALLHDCGAFVRIVARKNEICYNSVPDPDAGTLLRRLQRPPSGIGRGWRSYFCASAPLLFYRLPVGMRLRAIDSHTHPAAGWFMRDRIEGRIPKILGRELAKAEAKQGRVTLTLADHAGNEERLTCDHVVAATGYRPDFRRLPFLAPDLLSRIAQWRNAAMLSDTFETSVQGLYAIGPAAAYNFGPLMRFMVGAEFAALRVGAQLERKFSASGHRRAA